MNKKYLSATMFLLLFSVLFSLSIAQSKDQFRNPILAGFYPDPSICKVGSDYYLVNSTFGYFPGIPIFQSKDLVTWTLLGHVLDRPEQLNLDGMGITRGLFAPAIRYNNGIFYVTCTLVDGGGNFVVTSKKPEGPWSNPTWLPEVNGIDPSPFFDDNGKAYILYNSDAPENKPLYNGHRTIRIREFDPQNLKVSTEEKIIVNGGVDLSKKPVWIEGPHIYKINGKYFLTAAEGGTAEDHSQVIFKSDNVFGPYMPYDKNPILTQRHLNPDRKNPITCTGHADFVQADSGDWWAVFLACRPHEPFVENNYNTGRETFLAPISWIDGWPVINYGFEEVQHYYLLPTGTIEKTIVPFNGNFSIKENFDEKNLPNYFMFIRTPKENWYSLLSKKGFLEMNLRPETVSGTGNPSYIARRQQHSYCSISTEFEFSAQGKNEKAGLIAFQMEEFFYFFCKSKVGKVDVVQLYKANENKIANNMELIAQNEVESGKTISLKIEAKAKEYSFFYAVKKDNWLLLQDKVDASFLSPRNVYGFVGTVMGMYATSLGKPSRNKVFFDWIEYSGKDKITR